ncbi:MAG: hypothetical protein JJT78_12150 [Leptospira sp.]|nr:hypothetical protein [Leptospira sp.]
MGIAIYFLFPWGVQYVWNQGDRQVYDFSYQVKIRARPSPNMDWTKSENQLEGKLNLYVYSADSNMVRLGIQLSPVKYSENGKPNQLYNSLYSQLFLVEMKPDGRIVSYRFPNTISRQEELALSEIMYQFQATLDSRSQTWSILEKDSESEFYSEYKIMDSDIHKSKSKYIDSSIDVLKYEGIFRLSENLSWLESAFIEENLLYRRENVIIMETNTLVSLNYLQGESNLSAGIWQNTDWSQVVSEFSQGEKEKLSMAEKNRLEAVRKSIPSSAWNQLIRKLNQDQDYETLNRMRDFFILYPEELTKVEGILKSGTLNDTAQSALIHVLELAGTTQAQKTLLQLADSTSISEMNRIRSVIAVGDVVSPTEETISGLSKLTEIRNSDISKDLSNSAILSLGRIASTAKSISDSTILEGAKSIIHNKLDDPKLETEAKSATIRAVANTGDRGLFEKASQYMESSDSNLRIAAVSILDASTNPADGSKLNQLFTKEEESRVREEILRVQLNRSPDPDTYQLIEKSFSQESNTNNRMLMVDYLAKNKSIGKDSNQKLESILKNETDPDVRAKLYKAIHSRKYNP